MEGLRCPICKAITVSATMNDGDLIRCNICNSKYTVTPLRRLFIQTSVKNRNENKEALQKEILNMNTKQLLDFLELIISELKVRNLVLSEDK